MLPVYYSVTLIIGHKIIMNVFASLMNMNVYECQRCVYKYSFLRKDLNSENYYKGSMGVPSPSCV